MLYDAFVLYQFGNVLVLDRFWRNCFGLVREIRKPVAMFFDNKTNYVWASLGRWELLVLGLVWEI